MALRLGGAWLFHRTNYAIAEEAVARERHNEPDATKKYGTPHIRPERGEYEGALFKAMHPNRENDLFDFTGIKAILEEEAETFRQHAEREHISDQASFAEKLSQMANLIPDQSSEPFIPPELPISQ